MVFSQQRKITVKCKSKLIILNLKEKSSPPNILFISDPSCSGDEMADDSCKTLDTRDLWRSCLPLGIVGGGVVEWKMVTGESLLLDKTWPGLEMPFLLLASPSDTDMLCLAIVSFFTPFCNHLFLHK